MTDELREHATTGRREDRGHSRAERLLGSARCDCGRPVVEIHIARSAGRATVTGYCRDHQIKEPVTTDAGRRLQLEIAERETTTV